MSDNLFLKYDAADTGSPRPVTGTFWLSPAVVLATADGNYTVTNPPTPTTIDVQVSLMSPPATYDIINVEVWVCDPTTVAGPSTALPPFQGATPQQLTLTGAYAPPTEPEPERSARCRSSRSPASRPTRASAACPAAIAA